MVRHHRIDLDHDDWFTNCHCPIGQSCRNRNGLPGQCKLIYDCAQAIRDLKAGLGRDLCQSGTVVEVVCCVEQGRPRPPSSAPVQSPSRPNLSNLRLADQSKIIGNSPGFLHGFIHQIEFQSVMNTVNWCMRQFPCPVSYLAANPPWNESTSVALRRFSWWWVDRQLPLRNSLTWPSLDMDRRTKFSGVVEERLSVESSFFLQDTAWLQDSWWTSSVNHQHLH